MTCPFAPSVTMNTAVSGDENRNRAAVVFPGACPALVFLVIAVVPCAPTQPSSAGCHSRPNTSTTITRISAVRSSLWWK
jgi:hypothetical protein